MNHLDSPDSGKFVVYGGTKLELGTLRDFPDEEMASFDELELQVVKAELEPVLALPYRRKKSGYFRAWDSSEEIGFDAFATVDYDKYRPEFDKARYKADKLSEELRDMMIMFSIMSEKIASKAKYEILKLLSKGRLDIGQISDVKMYFLAEQYLRILRVNKEIIALRKSSADRKRKELEKWLDSLG